MDYTDNRLLNIELYHACSSDPVDFDKVKQLLEKGADPMGFMDEDEFDVVYGEILYDRGIDDADTSTLEELTELFINYGMKDRWHEQNEKIKKAEYNVFWMMAFLSAEKAIPILKLLIDENIEIDVLNELVDHCAIDSSMLLSEPEEVFNFTRMLMYVASYGYIIEKDEYLRRVIDFDKNEYDLKKFSNPFQFCFTMEASEAKDPANNQGAVVQIFECDSKRFIWKIVL